jgi:transcriptional/translational regulatory protein YebC/TACO1
MSSTSKDITKLIKKARQQGWRVEQTKNCHYKFFAPNGTIVVAGSTPSENRGFKNLKSRLRARGFVE